MSTSLRQAPLAALAGVRDAHGGGTRCPQCGSGGHSRLDELELEVNPGGTVLPEMLIEHLGHAAERARSEAEAEAFIGAVIPLAARLVPTAAPAIMRVTPQLVRGVARMTRSLRGDASTRPLVRAIPAIVRDTAVALASGASRGDEVTPHHAVRTLAERGRRVLEDPGRRRLALERSRRLDRRYHEAACPRTYEGGAPDPIHDRRPLLISDVDDAAWRPRRGGP